MRNLWENGILQRILLLVVIGALLGISPLPHIVEHSLTQVGRAQKLGAPLSRAENLALVAEHIPWRNSLWETAGHEALIAKNPEIAIAYFKQAAASGSLSQEGYHKFGDAYEMVGNAYTALQVWDAANRIYGPSEIALTRIADIQRRNCDYPALVETLRSIAKLQSPGSGLEPLGIPLNYELGMLLAAVDPASAPPYLLQAAEQDPTLTEAASLAFTIQRALSYENPTYTLMTTGRKLADLDNWKLAAYAFQQVVDMQPEYGEAWAFLGEALQHLTGIEAGKYTIQPYSALEKAININPFSLPANTFMALYWQRSGDYENAYPYLSIAEEIDPSNPDIQVDLGAASAVLGDLESAASHYWEAIEMTSGETTYLRELAEFSIRYNYELEEIALPIARQAMLADPDGPSNLDVMGQVLFRLGDLFSAERFFIRAINHNPDFAPAHLHLGLVYNLQGKTRQANNAFNKAITLAPGTPTAEMATRYLSDSIIP